MKIIIIIIILILIIYKIKEHFYVDNIDNNDVIVKNDDNDILARAKDVNSINWDEIYKKYGYDDYYIIFPNGEIKTFYYLMYSKSSMFNSSFYEKTKAIKLNVNKNKKGPAIPKAATPFTKIK